MIVAKSNRGPLLRLLLSRWAGLATFAATQQLYADARQQEALVVEQQLITQLIAQAKPEMQIEIIKTKIVEILPEARFIAPAFQSPVGPLTPNDFMEIYVQHQEICIRKVCELMRKMKIQ